ncbi:hypothetical protein C6Z76_001278 [Salmonella enterica subsp. enterica serovar Norwich]|nr:hypothetical protein [Salmonella enterica subsp. enterica serovar Norwich]
MAGGQPGDHQYAPAFRTDKSSGVYGNAIVAPAAATFIRSFMECAGYDLI